MKLLSVLPVDRWQPGTLTCYADDGTVLLGPVRCRGKADSATAERAGNPRRESTKKDGDFPCGVYRVVSVQRNKQPPRSYGAAFLLLDPTGGEALEAKRNGRAGIAIHGGDAGAAGDLRATAGCLRVDNSTAAALADMIEPILANGHTVDCEVRGADEKGLSGAAAGPPEAIGAGKAT